MHELGELVLAWDSIAQDATLRLLPWLGITPGLIQRMNRMRDAVANARAALHREETTA